MPIDPGTAILISQGLNFAGGLVGGGNKMSKEQLAEMQRQFDEQMRWTREMGRTQNIYGQVEAMQAPLRGLETAPLRDQASFLLQQRLGLVPQDFVARDAFNPGQGTPTGGGIDVRALTQAAGSYRPGMGTVDEAPYRMMLNRLGMQVGGPGTPWSIGNPQIDMTGISPPPPRPPVTAPPAPPSSGTPWGGNTNPWGNPGIGGGGTFGGAPAAPAAPGAPTMDPADPYGIRRRSQTTFGGT